MQAGGRFIATPGDIRPTIALVMQKRDTMFVLSRRRMADRLRAGAEFV